ncbi:hypothetical protein ASPZODRAFT_104002 [Penicilliopsis zonata CBS 506.65]|uniref:Major facilitator superfamily (MFS) profile domain-containing protein n=1 Tax=Penicilliopsis zonata CBS 506.65 TaxID=1073090 RepID=A0A1L9S7I9_9EURO|nr:hypothetical protein ASPZODRAFT_104002 [Penicilliopsis zonata CBS 506.65]OJJ43103.1 hypothetical protein ASPZODRAFT_104002 [Penicilliopsis zonata CBS 506.65]
MANGLPSSPSPEGTDSTRFTPVKLDQEDAEKPPRRDDDSSKDPFLVAFSGDDDPRSPRSMSNARKWLIVIVASTTIVTLGLSLFVIGLGLGPMFLAPLSEFYGRRPVYIISMFLFVIWIIPTALAQNLATIMISRFLTGFVGSAFLSVAGGTVGDLFDKHSLGAPMMIYTASPFLGPELGPIVGGFINYNVNWRWSFYVLIMWSFFQWVALCFFVPETYHPAVLRSHARKLRKETGDDRYYAAIEKLDRSIIQTIIRSCYRPFLLLFFEPMCLCLCLFCAVLLGVLYLFFEAFPLIFENNHGFNLWQVGLSFLGLTVGMILGVSTNPLFQKNYMKLLARHEAETGEKGGSEPEYRLPPAVVGAPLVTIGLMWFSWTTYASVHWIVPIIGSTIFAIGLVMVFSGAFTFLVDAYPTYAASALAANSFARSMFAGAFPLFGTPMYKNLGYEWASFLLTMITVCLLPFPYIFYKYGKRIRQRSKFATSI